MSSQRPWVRILRGVGITMAVALVLGNVALNARWLPRKISDDERLAEWDFAWMILPNRIHVSGFHIEDRTQHFRWALDLDSASFWLDLGALLDGDFHVTSLEASGVRFDVRKREHEPSGGGSGGAAGGERPRIWLEWVVLHEVRSLCLFDGCLRGDTTIRGGFRLQPLEWFEVGPASLRTEGGRVELGGLTLATPIDGTLRVSIRRVPVERTSGLEHLRYVGAGLDVRARIDQLGRIASSSGASKPTAGRGEVRIHAQLEDGRITEGSRLDGSIRGAAFPTDDHIVWISGPLSARVRGGLVHAALGPAELRARTREAHEMQLSSDRFEVRWDGLGTDLAEPEVRSALVLRLDEGRVHAPFASPWLPDVLTPDGGAGPISARGSWDLSSGGFRLRAHARMDDVTLTVEPAHVRTRVEVSARIRKEGRGGRLDLDETRIALSDLAIHGSEEDVAGWSGRVAFGDAIPMTGEERIANRARVQMRDAMPILALLEATEDPPDIAQRLLEAPELSGTADAHLGGGGIAFEDIDLESEDLEIEGRFGVHRGKARYRLYFDAGIPSLGIVRDEGGVSFHPFGIGM